MKQAELKVRVKRALRYGQLGLLLACLGACALTQPTIQTTPRHCSNHKVTLDALFEAGQLGHCEVNAQGEFALLLQPEDAPPINPSPWYALRVSGAPGQRVHLTITADGTAMRYWPKASLDRINWQALPASQVQMLNNGTQMQVSLTLTQGLLWLAAQPLLADHYFTDWYSELTAHRELSLFSLGQSLEGRPLMAAQSGAKPEWVLLMGRQHPPEVTGTLAMRSFVQTLLGSTPLAKQFRARFQVVIMPAVNPDGVAHGHWRHNLGGSDLNRDWGPFTQPETQAINQWVGTQQQGSRLRTVLDFHSTYEDLFYTQPQQTPPDFASRWLGQAQQQLPNFKFTHAHGPVTDQANAKNYFYKRFGVPTATYESGDETAPVKLQQAAQVFAQTWMQTLLALPAVSKTGGAA